jgi:tRNA (adenine37-N6)-methyltransferase
MKRKKPPQDHTSQAATPELRLEVIGHVRSPYKERFGTPRQPPVTEQTLEDRALEASIELLPGRNFEQALKDLAGFEYIWVLAWLHLNEGWNPQVVPPRGPEVKRGLFATRAPHRPNPIGLSALRLIGIEGRVLKVRGIDLLDGTPVLDIKPYIPYSDAFPDAKAGWLEGLPPDGPDRFK